MDDNSNDNNFDNDENCVRIIEQYVKVPILAIGKYSLVVSSKDWAPGVWAGCEGATVTINDNSFIIEDIDMLFRQIHFTEPIHGAKAGDFIIIKTVIEDGR